jgi:hypothetical protein
MRSRVRSSIVLLAFGVRGILCVRCGNLQDLCRAARRVVALPFAGSRLLLGVLRNVLGDHVPFQRSGGETIGFGGLLGQPGPHSVAFALSRLGSSSSARSR